MKFTKSVTSLIILIVILISMMSAFSAKSTTCSAKSTTCSKREGSLNNLLSKRWGWNPFAAAKKAALAVAAKARQLASRAAAKVKAAARAIAAKAKAALAAAKRMAKSALKKTRALAARAAAAAKKLAAKGKAAAAAAMRKGKAIAAAAARKAKAALNKVKKMISKKKSAPKKPTGGKGKKPAPRRPKSVPAPRPAPIGPSSSVGKDDIPTVAPLTPAAVIAVAKGSAFCKKNCVVNFARRTRSCLVGNKSHDCKRCVMNPKLKMNPFANNICENVCDSVGMKNPCEFFGYHNGGKKKISGAALKKFGLALIRRR